VEPDDRLHRDRLSQRGRHEHAPLELAVEGTVDLQEQADCYTAAFNAVAGKPWFGGMFWWGWDTNPSAGGPYDSGYTPWRKPAGDILAARY